MLYYFLEDTMIFEDERQLLKIIKYTPTIFVLIIAIIFLIIEYTKMKTNFENEKNSIQTEFSQKTDSNG